VLLVEHGDDEERGIAAVDGLSKHLLGADFDAGGGADDAERAIRRRETRDRVPLEVEIAGRVDQVDLRVHPLGVRDAEVDGVFAVDFFG
jgi:hypothetical protein